MAGGGLHPTLYTLHPTPYTLHPTPYTLHPTPYTLHPTPYTLSQTPYTSHPTPYTLHPHHSVGRRHLVAGGGLGEEVGKLFVVDLQVRRLDAALRVFCDTGCRFQALTQAARWTTDRSSKVNLP